MVALDVAPIPIWLTVLRTPSACSRMVDDCQPKGKHRR
jgi:hypothetical protein